MPTASTTTKGGVKIGTGLAMNGDTLKVTLSGGETSSNNFTEQVTPSGGFVSKSVANFSNGTINARVSSIDVTAATIDATTSVLIKAGDYSTGGATISGYPTFSGNPQFTGNPTFNKPIYIANTNSYVQVGLCCDVTDGKPRLRLRMNGYDYIFNCDTSVTSGSG